MGSRAVVFHRMSERGRKNQKKGKFGRVSGLHWRNERAKKKRTWSEKGQTLESVERKNQKGVYLSTSSDICEGLRRAKELGVRGRKEMGGSLQMEKERDHK